MNHEMGSESVKQLGHFSELLKVETKLALREPLGLGMGVILPVILLLVFGFIGRAVPGEVANSGFTIIDLWIPTLMVIGFVSLGIYSLPYTLVGYREIGWLRRISTTPVPPSRLLGVHLIINLALAIATILIIVFGGEIIFGASISVSIPFFILSIILSIAELFSLGLLIAAVISSRNGAMFVSSVLLFALFFLSGLWVQPVQVGGLLQTIMYYSPSGAAVRALLDSAFNSAPPYTTIVTMVAYTIVFSFLAIRYFRWE